MSVTEAIAALHQPHGTKMNRMYRTQRHFYDLTRKYYLLGRDRLIAELNAQPGLSVLEVGCGTGRNLITAARRWPSANFTGLDISSAMLEKASSSLTRYGLRQNITLLEADACDYSTSSMLNDVRFDRIFLSYTLSMIPAWEYAIEEAMTALAPGGSIHIVDFGQQERLPRWFGHILSFWLRQFHVYPRADLRAVLEDVAARHDRVLEFTPLHRGYAWLATLR